MTIHTTNTTKQTTRTSHHSRATSSSVRCEQTMPPKKRERCEGDALGSQEAPTSRLPTVAAGGGRVFLGFFRALNISGHNVIRMEALSGVLLSCGALRCDTYIQSGNVVFSLPPTNDDDVQLKEFIANVLGVLQGVEHGIRNTEFVVRSVEELEGAMRRTQLLMPPLDGGDATGSKNTKGAKTVTMVQGPATRALHANHVLCFLFADAVVPTALSESQPQTGGGGRRKPVAPPTVRSVAEELLAATGRVGSEEILCPSGATASMPTAHNTGAPVAELFVHFPDGVGRSKLTIEVARKCFGASTAPTARNWLTLSAMLTMARSMQA